MELVLNVAPYSGFVYPNEVLIPWGILIVVYPYITGLVAGAFIVSSLYHVFKMQALKPVARLSLVTALAFMFFVPLPLLAHLEQPQRAFNIMLTPNPTSAMAVFGYIASFYLMVLALEVWFSFRGNLVTRGREARGASRLLFRLVTLGSDDLSPNAMVWDRKWITALAVIGIPAACGLHGYVGFIFGSLKARDWWASPLTPIIFLSSAVVSGVALVILLYLVITKVRGAVVDMACLRTLVQTLWGFLIVDLVFEMLELLQLLYLGREGIETIMRLMFDNLGISLWLLQVLMGSLVPLIWLTVLATCKVSPKWLWHGALTCATLILVGIFAMRWNVVIGGQELSKTLSGLLHYSAPIMGRDGILMSAALLVGPFVLLWVFARFLPLWEGEAWQLESPEAGNRR